jgi:ADP-heptose:LPS heptosyltransferase
MQKGIVQRIAVLRALYVGDMLCIIPAVRAVRAAYPDAQICLIGLPWQKDFVKRFSHYFDEHVHCPGFPALPEQPLDAHASVNFLHEMQSRQFDLVLQMQGNGAITNAMVMLFGAKLVAGLRLDNEYCPDEQHFPVSTDRDHEIERFLKIVDALNVPRQGVHLEFPISKEEFFNFQEVASLINLRKRKYICLHPGARDTRRRWSAEFFANVADRLIAHGYVVLLTGSGDEADVLHAVNAAMHAQAIDLVKTVGHVDLGVLAAIIRESAFLVSNDTGVSHLAAAFSVPSVILFSQYSDPRRWAPLNKSLHTALLFEEADPDKVCELVLSNIEEPRDFTHGIVAASQSGTIQ